VFHPGRSIVDRLGIRSHLLSDDPGVDVVSVEPDEVTDLDVGDPMLGDEPADVPRAGGQPQRHGADVQQWFRRACPASWITARCLLCGWSRSSTARVAPLERSGVFGARACSATDTRVDVVVACDTRLRTALANRWINDPVSSHDAPSLSVGALPGMVARRARW